MTDTIEELDKLAFAGDELALQFGHIANKYLEDNAGPNWGRGDLTEAADQLAQRYAKYDLRRVTIIDRMRIGRYFDAERVAELPGRPTYHQLRACYVGGVWPNADAEKTEALVTWAMEHGHDGQWASPHEINAHKNGRPEEQPWQIALRNLLLWGHRFIDRSPDEMKPARAVVTQFLKDVINVTSQTNGKDVD